MKHHTPSTPAPLEPRVVNVLAEVAYRAGRDAKPYAPPPRLPAHVTALLRREWARGFKHAHGIDGPPVRYVLAERVDK